MPLAKAGSAAPSTSGVSRMRIVQKKYFAGILAAALALAGCSTTPTGAANAKGIHAVATTTQICDYLTQIANNGMKLVKTDSAGHETTSGDGDVTLNLTCLPRTSTGTNPKPKLRTYAAGRNRPDIKCAELGFRSLRFTRSLGKPELQLNSLAWVWRYRACSLATISGNPS